MNWLLSILFILYGFVLAALSLRILMKRRSVGITLAWLLFIFSLPLLGFIFYLLFGERYLGRMRAKRAKKQFEYYSLWLQKLLINQQNLTRFKPELRPVMELTRGSAGMPVLANNQWQLFSQADAVFKHLIDDINAAQNCIFIEFYILEAAGNVELVLSALESAAQQQVEVFIMLDSVGSNRFLNSKRCEKLQQTGVNVIEVLHANLIRMSLRRLDLRQHRKLISIDNNIAYTGSMNLADPSYFKTKSGVGPWVDIMVRLEGDIANIIQGALVFDWEMETGHRMDQQLDWPNLHAESEQNLMQLLPSGPALDEEILLQVLLTAIHTATRKVVITTPYFVPDEALLQALKSAAKRGLSVTLIVPRSNDSKLAQLAGNSFYEELLIAGVQIARFNNGLLHSKTVVIDNHLVLMGSVNLDMRSIWLNFEATLIVDDEAFCQGVLNIIDSYIEQSQQLTLLEWRTRPFYKRLLENIAQLASPLL